jgi:hypothetical protein
MRLELYTGRFTFVSALALIAVTLVGCSADSGEGSAADGAVTNDAEPARDEQGAILGTLEQGIAYPYCFSAFSDPDGDGWGWELNRPCVVMKMVYPPAPASGFGAFPACGSALSDPDGDGWGWENNRVCLVSKAPASGGSTSSSGSSSSGSSASGPGAGGASCSNVEGVYSTMAALAVAAAKELGRWQPTRDFVITRQGGEEMLGLSAAGRAECADGVCANTQALLDFQKREADGNVTFPGNVKLNSPALRSRLVARFREQQSCEMQPDNQRAENCPVEEHTLSFLRSEKGGCDTNFFFLAKTPSGGSLAYPEQLKNKLLWADKANPYIGFRSDGDEVSIDPTYGLNEDSTSTDGACSAACARISRSNVSGQCCACNGATRSFSRSAWNAATYLCQ